jgi:N-dimethylarginine dimethylaminohydrolase
MWQPLLILGSYVFTSDRTNMQGIKQLFDALTPFGAKVIPI